MRHRFAWMVVTVMMVWGFSLVPVRAEDTPADNGRTAIVEAIIVLFKEKGTFTGEEADALREKMKTLNGEGRDLEAIAFLLHKKGALSDEETSETIHKITSNYLPGGDIDVTLDYFQVVGVISNEEAEMVRKKLHDSPLGKEKAYYEGVAAYVIREMRKELQAQKKEVQEEAVKEAKVEAKKILPEWTNRFKFFGDIRLRYQGDYLDGNNADLLNPSNPTQLLNTKTDRQRLRLRARLGVSATVNDEVDAVLRITTGDTATPTSTTTTLDDYFNRKAITLDLAYLKWSPTPQFYIMGGRVPNPWLCTDLVWAPDLNFDGFAFNYNAKMTPTLAGFVTGGAFPVQEVEFSSRDKWLFAGQVGVHYKPTSKINAKLGVAFYDFTNMTGKANSPDFPNVNDFTSPLFQQKGNTLMDIDPTATVKTALASDFQELNVTGFLDLGYWHPVHAVFIGDYVRNLGFNLNQVRDRTGNPFVTEDINGYQVGVALGHPEVREFAQWKGYFFYKYIGADAVVDAFTDPDFHLGGTNAKGWIIGGEFGLMKNFWLSSRWITSNEISGPPLSIDTLQVNIHGLF